MLATLRRRSPSTRLSFSPPAAAAAPRPVARWAPRRLGDCAAWRGWGTCRRVDSDSNSDSDSDSDSNSNSDSGMGHLQAVLQGVRGLLPLRPDSRPQLAAAGAEAAWRLGCWPDVEFFLETASEQAAPPRGGSGGVGVGEAEEAPGSGGGVSAAGDPAAEVTPGGAEPEAVLALARGVLALQARFDAVLDSGSGSDSNPDSDSVPARRRSARMRRPSRRAWSERGAARCRRWPPPRWKGPTRARTRTSCRRVPPTSTSHPRFPADSPLSLPPPCSSPFSTSFHRLSSSSPLRAAPPLCPAAARRDSALWQGAGTSGCGACSPAWGPAAGCWLCAAWLPPSRATGRRQGRRCSPRRALVRILILF